MEDDKSKTAKEIIVLLEQEQKRLEQDKKRFEKDWDAQKYERDDSSTLKTIVAHALEKPLQRLDSFKFQHLKTAGYTGELNWKGVKTGAKKFGPRWSRQVRNAKHFVITDELMEIVAPMVLKGNYRQFENAFQNSRIPFNSVFIEWNRHLLIKTL